MARGRMIYPDMFTDHRFMNLSIRAKLLWIGLIAHADDHGRGRADLKVLNSKIFISHDFGLDEIGENLGEISNQSMIKLYEIDGEKYYYIPKWPKYQKLERLEESIYPEPIPNPPQIGAKEKAKEKREENEENKSEEKRKEERTKEEKRKEEKTREAKRIENRKGLAGIFKELDNEFHLKRWNSIAVKLQSASIRNLKDDRSKALKARLEEWPDLWNLVESEIPYLKEFAFQGWVTFDWLMKPRNLRKFLEGTYRKIGNSNQDNELPKEKLDEMYHEWQKNNGSKEKNAP